MLIFACPMDINIGYISKMAFEISYGYYVFYKWKCTVVLFLLLYDIELTQYTYIQVYKGQ